MASSDDETVDGAEESVPSDDVVEPTLADICPNPLVIQTDWFPSPEHGYAYRLIGEAGELNTDTGVFRGPLGDTGIDLEMRAGGPYLGFQPTTSTMYVDTSIHLGYVNTDESVANAADLPTVAVMAPLEVNPQILMWNPELYDFTTFEEIGAADVTVSHFAGAIYIDYLVAAGILRSEQIDSSYDGSPARFVSENGALAQQGFATSEPYRYEFELEEWGRPVGYLLVHDSGYEIYSQTLAVRSAALPELADCLAEVVPILQQAVVDHWSDPQSTNDLIVQIVEDLASSWVLFPGQMEFSARTALELGIVGNGPDNTVGNFDDNRMASVTELLAAVLDGVPEGLQPADLYTNQFIDASIGF